MVNFSCSDEGVQAVVLDFAAAVAFSSIEYFAAVEDTCFFVTDEDSTVVNTAADVDSSKGVAACVDIASSEDFSDAKDNGSFDTAKDEADVDTAGNFAVSEDSGSSDNVISDKYVASAKGVVAFVDAAADK